VDVLTDGKNAYHLPGIRLNAPHQHGSGCVLASAAAAGLAQGLSLPEAVNQARRLTHQALKYGLPLGRGRGPVNPYAPFARDLARFQVLEDLKAAAARLQREDLSPLIPEVMTNLGFATPYPEGPQDVAAFPGRLVKSPSGVLIPAAPSFGASRQIAAVILTAMAIHPELRSAMNIRYVERIADLAPLLHLKVATDERGHEFENVLKPGEAPPDLICYQGDTGREAMTVILGPNPMAVAEKALALKNALQAGGKLPE
jgi:hydroxymethylpyrimidine/phosphomethylpyrimidine kinase